MKFFLLIIENIRRNMLRTALTAMGTMVLVLVVTLVWSILSFIDEQVTEKSANVKAIVTEKWRIPSQMPYTYKASLIDGGTTTSDGLKPTDYMTWTFFVGFTEKEPAKRAFENFVFAFVMEPEKVMTMLDDLDSLPPKEDAELKQAVEKLKETRNGIILGPNFLRNLNKKVGDRLTVYSLNYKDIDLELEIVGAFPPGRYSTSSVMQRDYFNASLEKYERDKGKKHPMADKSLNLVWLKSKNMNDFNTLANQITSSPLYSNPAVKVETSASGVAAFLASYQTILKGLRYLLAPAILLTLSLISANAISISVRERQKEFAVLKVLGFRPMQILGLVLGESLLIGISAGVLSAALTYYLINGLLGGVPFPVAFYTSFPIPAKSILWGAIVGGGTALAGSLLPAWSARTVRISEVFSRVA
jgi:putative ABC transport system permease protein